MDDLHYECLRRSWSMQHYADGDGSFVLGDWRAWERACTAEGRVIPPAEFKERLRRERQEKAGEP